MSRYEIEKEMKKIGYWWPPDFYVAMEEGRDHYFVIDGSSSYPITEHHRRLYDRAIERVRYPHGQPQYGMGLR